jgi:hypothetical protein
MFWPGLWTSSCHVLTFWLTEFILDTSYSILQLAGVLSPTGWLIRLLSGINCCLVVVVWLLLLGKFCGLFLLGVHPAWVLLVVGGIGQLTWWAIWLLLGLASHHFYLLCCCFCGKCMSCFCRVYTPSSQ